MTSQRIVCCLSKLVWRVPYCPTNSMLFSRGHGHPCPIGYWSIVYLCRIVPDMAANQRNFQVFTYVDDNGTSWNKRGTLDAAQNALDGSSALTAGAPVWINTKRKRVREAVFFDPTTFRTVHVIVYTAAAFAAITGATTLNVNVPGEVAAVTYTLSEKIAEKQPVGKATRQLTDHA